MKLGLVISMFALAACAHNPTQSVRVVTVDKPVAVSCVPQDLPPAPLYPDTDEALRVAPDIYESTKLLVVGRMLRKDRTDTLEAVVNACR